MNKKFMSYMISESMSKHTIRAYTSDINGCLNFIGKPDNEINYSDLIDWKASISDLASATIARKVVAVRVYFKYLFDSEIITANPSIKLKVPDVENKIKTALTAEQIRAMIDCANKLRSKAIITLLTSTGMRISELLGLTIEQYQQNPIIIKGKGNKYRTIYLSSETREVVDLYIASRGESEYNNVFLSSGRRPMQPTNVSIMLKNTAKKAGIDNWNDISNHWLRTAAATILNEAGQPIEVIQTILGHESPKTTMRYVKISEQRVKQAMTKQLF